MSGAVNGRRPYRSDLRAQRAHANRLAILEAARRRFAQEGYPGTSVAAVARDAGVSEDLVYRHFPTKRDLLGEVLNFAVTGESDSPPVRDQEGPRAVRAETDQHRQIELFATDIARRISAGRPVFDVMRSAAVVDPQIAEQYHSLQHSRLVGLSSFVEWLAANGPLRIDAETAAATVWAITGPDTHRQLVDDLGWSEQQFADWVRTTLSATLLPPG